jgi:hypothetical protein
MSLDQSTPFDADFVEVTQPLRPWLPAVDVVGADWFFRPSGEFPVRRDPALIIEEEGSDVR